MSQSWIEGGSVQKKLWRLPGTALLFFLTFSLPAFSSQESIYKLNEEGLAKLNDKDYDGAIKAFKEAYRYDPSNKNIIKNLAIAYNNYGFFLAGKGDARAAIEKYEYALSYDAENVYTLYNLAQSYYAIQNIVRAKEYLQKAHQLDPSIQGIKELLDKVSQEEKTEKEFERFETMHFIIAASEDIAVENVSYIKTYLEEAYGKIGTLLDHYPKERVVVVLYSEANYETLLEGRPHWAMSIFDGKVRIPVNKFKYTNQDVVQIIYHEYSHAVVYDITKGNCPAWLKEGIASWVEDFVGLQKKNFVKSYVEKFGITPLRDMPETFFGIKERHKAMSLYVESYLLVDYIIARAGYRGLQEVLHSLARTSDIEAIIRDVLKKDIEQFEEERKQFLIDTFNIEVPGSVTGQRDGA